jgi:replicative DNA helicase
MSDAGDRDAEGPFIGCLVMDGIRCVSMAVEAGVGADWFTEKKCAALWTAVRGMFDADAAESIDGVTLMAEVRRLQSLPEKERPRGIDGVDAALVEALLDATPTAAHFEYYLELLREARTRRLAATAAREFTAALAHGSLHAIHAFGARLADIAEGSTGAADVLAGDLAASVMGDFRKAHQIRIVEGRMDYVPGIPMPWESMTQVYQGLQPGLHILGARPSVGKTLQTGNFMRYWCDTGLHVGFVCLDMETLQFVKRCVCEKGRVSLAKAEFGTTTAAQIERLQGASQDICDWRLRLTMTDDISAIRAWAMTKKMKGQLDVLVVDFLQLCEFDGAWRMGVDDRTGRITKTLKRIANTLRIPVLALSQLNRAAPKENRDQPRLDDLRGSGNIEQDAFSVAMLWTDTVVAENWKLVPPTCYTPKGMADTGRRHMAAGIKPVWYGVIKQQNGRHEKWPFVYFQNYFCAMMGDRMAKPIITGEGRSKAIDNSPLFGRVLPDWRHDRIEQVFVQNGALANEDETEET